MAPNQTTLLQGTLDLLIRKTICDGEFHGLGIASRVEQITQGTLRVRPGSLFPALHRMEEAGWLIPFGANQRTTVALSTTGAQKPASVSGE